MRGPQSVHLVRGQALRSARSEAGCVLVIPHVGAVIGRYDRQMLLQSLSQVLQIRAN